MLLLYTPHITERLRYIVNTALTEIAGAPTEITTDKDYFNQYEGPKINYSKEQLNNCFHLYPHELLFEEDIKPQQVTCFETRFWFEGQPVKAFFKTDQSDFYFDILAASFYLISRYEEYLPHQKDEYGRYSHKESLAFKKGFLHIPLVNVWLEEFKKTLQQKYPDLYFKLKHLKFIPTYDIDVAYAYKHKGWYRTAGGFIRSIINGQWSMALLRLKVLLGKAPDPYDAYEWMDSLHLYSRRNPIYFFPVAQKQAGYDKNTSTSSKAYRELIAYYSKGYKTGLHPSWQSNADFKILKEEKELLDVLTDSNVMRSRQHYLNFTLPQTFRNLISIGIEQEYSMGYGSINGFRASVASSFFWFDLEKNETTTLMLYPFCFMDANSYFEQKYTAHQAYAELKKYYHSIQKVNGLFITIWHNNFLGNNPQLKGWREVYEIFLKEDIYWD